MANRTQGVAVRASRQRPAAMRIDGALGLGELGGLAEGAGGAGEGAQGEQGEPAQDDVGSDAFFLGPVGFECSRDDG